jgi:SAM-dependent methyltransferase
MDKAKAFLYRFLMNSKAGRFILNKNFRNTHTDSTNYWENRYQRNGTSGAGSYGKNAEYKGGIINKFVKENAISRIVEFGCGDGNQLKYFEFDTYLGIDVSATVIRKCSRDFKNDHTKKFIEKQLPALEHHLKEFNAELALSLDVIYHLIEDEIFEEYMFQLFGSSCRYIAIYAWDIEGTKSFHVRHRKFTQWIAIHINGWRLQKKIESNAEGLCDFFIYEKFPSS